MIVLHCNPEVDDIDELIKELNRTNGLFKFVRVMREKFQEISRKGELQISYTLSERIILEKVTCCTYYGFYFYFLFIM